MCIAVHVPADIEISEDILRECFRSNPDGAGIMYTDGTNVYIQKGYMKIDEFVNAFKAVPSKFERSFHCRIATSGKVEEGCTHPFPIVADMKDMKNVKHVCKGAVAHNGVITWASPTKGRAEWYSDTMNFTSLILAPMIDKLHDPALHELIERSATGNKFIIMTPEKVHLLGTFIQEGGVFYSNSSFRKTVTVYSGYGDTRGCCAGYDRNYGRNNRKKQSMKNMSSLDTAYWIIFDAEGAIGSYALNNIASSLTAQGINVIEETEATVNGKRAFMFLVDEVPKSQAILGYYWSLLCQKDAQI